MVTVEPEEVMKLEDWEWGEIEMPVDSGASETVVGEDTLRRIETKEGEARRRGVQLQWLMGSEPIIHGGTGVDGARCARAT